jgi:dephospho-CoA kinase
VWDADDVAHDLLTRDGEVSRSVIEEFGARALDSHGQIDRTALGNIVFEDALARQRLNQIVHPAVKAMCDGWLSQCRSDIRLAVAIVPLLYEAGMASGWKAIICVACTRVTQLLRLRARGLSMRQAEQRIAAQMPLGAQMGLADYVIFNDGRRSILEKQTEMAMDSILERNAR